MEHGDRRLPGFQNNMATVSTESNDNYPTKDISLKIYHHNHCFIFLNVLHNALESHTVDIQFMNDRSECPVTNIYFTMASMWYISWVHLVKVMGKELWNRANSDPMSNIVTPVELTAYPWSGGNLCDRENMSTPHSNPDVHGGGWEGLRTCHFCPE